MTGQHRRLISVILPCFNEEHNIEALHRELSSVMEAVGDEYELIFIDDGSIDGTLGKLIGLADLDGRARVLEFSRNFGHQAAIGAGMDYAKGDAVIMMDADLQHPPGVIPELVERWRQGYEMVYTIRNDPPGTSALKKITAKAFYILINRLANVDIPENSADFRLLDRKVVDQLKALNEKTKFFRGLVNWVGFKKCAVHYDAAPRRVGESKYTLWRMMKFAFDGITSFSAFPLHLSTAMGMMVSVLSFVYAVYAVYIGWFTDRAVSGWTSLMVVVLFLGGVQLLSLGIIGEYLHRIYTESKARPSYILRSVHGERDSRRVS